MTRRFAVARISTELILQALHFPAGTRVVACMGERAAYPGEIDLVVEHDDLPATPESGKAPLITPAITLYYEDAVPMPVDKKVYVTEVKDGLSAISFKWGLTDGD